MMTALGLYDSKEEAPPSAGAVRDSSPVESRPVSI